MTYTYALMEVELPTYEEVKRKLLEAGYDHAIGQDGELDMHGIALVLKKEPVTRGSTG